MALRFCSRATPALRLPACCPPAPTYPLKSWQLLWPNRGVHRVAGHAPSRKRQAAPGVAAEARLAVVARHTTMPQPDSACVSVRAEALAAACCKRQGGWIGGGHLKGATGQPSGHTSRLRYISKQALQTVGAWHLALQLQGSRKRGVWRMPLASPANIAFAVLQSVLQSTFVCVSLRSAYSGRHSCGGPSAIQRAQLDFGPVGWTARSVLQLPTFPWIPHPTGELSSSQQRQHTSACSQAAITARVSMCSEPRRGERRAAKLAGRRITEASASISPEGCQPMSLIWYTVSDGFLLASYCTTYNSTARTRERW
jgi:hypothetical protein